jgi:ribosome-associated protein
MDDLVIQSGLTLPRDELSLQFSRAAGPGGQNVNKVNSKVTLRWHFARSKSLDAAPRQRLEQRLAGRLTRTGDLIVSSQRFRDQAKNIDDCREKLRSIVQSALRLPRTRKATRPSAASRRKRLADKRLHAEKKQARRPKYEE